jgi:hypothetical protein
MAYPVAAVAHGGGLDGYGCHQDHKHGGYHCHKGPLKGKSFATQAQMLDALHDKSANAAPAAPAVSPSTAAADCAKIKDPAVRLACHDKLSPPK